MNHYPHHIGDFVKDTLGFSQGAVGAYRLLMDAYYANEEAPSVDEVYVIGRATTAAERRAVEKALTKFELRNGRFHHKRVDEELAAYYGRADSARENGKKGGRPKKKPTGNPQITEQQTGHETHNEPSKKLASSQEPNPPSLRSGGARGTRLPADWVIPEALKAWTLKEQPSWDEAHVAKVAASFRDYWTDKPGKDGVKLQWAGTWRNWVRKEGPRKGPTGIVSTQSWRAGSEPDVVLEEAARKVQITSWQSGETHGQFRARILAEPGGEELLKPPRRAA